MVNTNIYFKWYFNISHETAQNSASQEHKIHMWRRTLTVEAFQSPVPLKSSPHSAFAGTITADFKHKWEPTKPPDDDMPQLL